jgi:flagellar biosynthesis protein FliQ
LQETTLSAVPRLLATGGATFFLMPWMWKQACGFTLQILSDFHPYIR